MTFEQRLVFCTLIALLIGLSSATAEPLPKRRIGFLSPQSATAQSVKIFREALNALGWVEEKNVQIEYRYAGGDLGKLSEFAAELVHLKVDVIVAGPDNAAAIAAKRLTKTIPIVMVGVVDPVSLGLVASLARPGGNVTGFTTLATILAGKRLEILKQTVPQIVRVAVLRNSQAADSDPQWRESLEVAPRIGLQLYSLDVQSPEGYENAFKEAIKAGNSGLAVMRHRLTVSYQKRLIDLAARFRLPTIYFREDFVQHGGLMSYGADEVEPFRRVAAMIDKIFKGTKPADIPVEQPTKFELAINLKTAKQIGLTIPPHVLARADRVIR